MEGILVINKPDGMTSHDVVAKMRKKFNIKKVGHAGTLDPLATGVLVILLGKATKLFDEFIAFDKAYRATMVLGTITDTADTEGAVIEQRPYHDVSEKDLEKVFPDFTGDLKQIPPMYSAVKYKGKKLYELARQGITVEREPRPVTIHQLKILNVNFPEVEFYMECSKGTYVRQLAVDIGERLGCGACISQIERVKVGHYNIKEAVNIEDVNESHIQSWRK
ncbi:MAG: tRNA pseudouridine(55) synthase TruB [Candidatus Omnitrophica bacterium]|nr:tRNA pseudouridine(55) synthase TruB [Candidatus Omnitrophota bacterium]